MRLCISNDVPFKATAGLHHPLRNEYHLTYEPDSPVGPMYGFLNVFLTAGFMRHRMSDEEAIELLQERNAAALVVTPTTICWRDHELDEKELRVMRDGVATSFGSCSFSEPVDELRPLSLLP